MEEQPRFRLATVSRIPPRSEGWEGQITANLSAGKDGHFVLCGTLTMSQSEWESFVRAMRHCMGELFELDDRHG